MSFSSVIFDWICLIFYFSIFLLYDLIVGCAYPRSSWKEWKETNRWCQTTRKSDHSREQESPEELPDPPPWLSRPAQGVNAALFEGVATASPYCIVWRMQKERCDSGSCSKEFWPPQRTWIPDHPWSPLCSLKIYSVATSGEFQVR